MINYDNEDSDFAWIGYSSYIRGYITGRNYELDRTLSVNPDSDSLYYAALKYCRDNPLESLSQAGGDIYSTLN